MDKRLQDMIEVIEGLKNRIIVDSPIFNFDIEEKEVTYEHTAEEISLETCNFKDAEEAKNTLSKYDIVFTMKDINNVLKYYNYKGKGGRLYTFFAIRYYGINKNING